jgi:hypothetical protein
MQTVRCCVPVRMKTGSLTRAYGEQETAEDPVGHVAIGRYHAVCSHRSEKF